MSARSKDVPVRWREDVGWELRCPQCSSRKRACFWPLTDEFWDRARSMQRCRACQRDTDARREREKYWASTSYRERRLIAARRYHHENKAGERLRAKIRWQDTLADPEKHAAALARSRASTARYRERHAAGKAA